MLAVIHLLSCRQVGFCSAKPLVLRLPAFHIGLLAYALIILTFTNLYLLNGQFAAPHLRWDEAVVLSVSSFHGRGFFTTDIHLGDTLARLAAGEAIVGLLIEITFIATFTQRFFSR